MTNFSHLCQEQRNTIEYLLVKKFNFTYIGNSINVDRTTIAKEIKRNRIIKSSIYLPFSKTGIKRAVNNCTKLQRPPYCCNGCENKNYCCKLHLYYNAKKAQIHYDEELKESRSGVDITDDEINIINKNIVPLVKEKNQSVNQIYANHPDILYFSRTTFYKYVDLGIIALNNIDLPRLVRYKKRKNKNEKTPKRDSAILLNRRYEDFIALTKTNKKLKIWELDTVIGKITDQKCLMTFMLVETNFMIIRLLDKKDVDHVDEAFSNLKLDLGFKLYQEVIDVVLTDNGSEFFDPIHIEINLNTGEKLCRVFYCHPNSPEEKAELEKNHEYIRYVLPKGTSFQELTDEEVKMLEDNINNIPREILGNKTPYELTKEKYPELIKKLNSKYIAPDDVTLNPKDIIKSSKK